MRLILLFGCLSISCLSKAQLNGKYTFRHIELKDGLLHTSIRGIAQDDREFVWILSLNGLQRFDGSRFVDFPQLTNTSTGFLTNSELFIDKPEDELGIIKSELLERMNLGTHRIQSLTVREVLDDKMKGTPEIFTDAIGTRFRIGREGVILYGEPGLQEISSTFNGNPDQQHRQSYVLHDTLADQYYFHDFNRLLIADRSTKTIESSGDSVLTHPFLKAFAKVSKGSLRVRFIMQDSYQHIWVATWSHFFYRYDPVTEKLTSYSLKDLKNRQVGKEKEDLTLVVNAMFEDRQRHIWVATDYAGLLVYDRHEDTFNYITSDDKIRNGLRYNFVIYCLFQDHHDNIWVGTDRGISIFNPYHNRFQSIRHVSDRPDETLPRLEINDVIETKAGEILIATWGGGISVFDTQWNFKRNITFSAHHDQNLLWSFVEVNDTIIWVGAQSGFLHMYNIVTDEVQTHQPPEIGQSTIRAMAKDLKGNIVLGMHNGMVTVWDARDRQFHPAVTGPSSIKLTTKAIGNVMIDNHNRCWVATEAELVEFDIQSRMYKAAYRPSMGDGAPHVFIQGIEIYDDSTLILGTRYGGLFLFNTLSGKFIRPFQDSTLNTASVYAIRKDINGNFWFTTDFSIYKTQPDFTNPVQYNIDDFTLTGSFVASRFYPLSGDRWATFTLAEIICFEPEQVTMDRHDKFNVEICGFKVFDQQLNIDSLIRIKEPVVLPYDRNFISVEFAVMDFSDIRQTLYEYRLVDVDQQWNRTSTKLFADYTDLKPGKYIFEVKAVKSHGSSEVTSLAIIITPPWWATAWFRIFSLLAIGTLVYLLVKKRIRTIRKESELKHRIAETEMMALRSQMNPHFIFNCINGIDAMIQQNDKYSATMYLNKFARLIRNVLDSSKHNMVSLDKDLETLQLYIELESFRHPEKFTATIDADPEVLQGDFKVPPLIIQPYVENAILHGLIHRNGRQGKLHIEVRKSGDFLKYTIEDNGVGRKHNNNNKQSSYNEHGYGMQMSQDRIRLFNEEETASVQITDLSAAGAPSGTRVNVMLKIQ